MEGRWELLELAAEAKAWAVDAFESMIELLAELAEDDNPMLVDETRDGV